MARTAQEKKREKLEERRRQELESHETEETEESEKSEDNAGEGSSPGPIVRTHKKRKTAKMKQEVKKVKQQGRRKRKDGNRNDNVTPCRTCIENGTFDPNSPHGSRRSSQCPHHIEYSNERYKHLLGDNCET
ncbi:hypothetical protein DFQ30_004472, partial [Apophysomyces sp. BC1015]